MPNRMEAKGWMRARTLWLVLAVMLCWVSHANWDVFLYGTAFALAPWTVLLVAGALARGQVRPNARNGLLFGMAGFYVLAALRNGNLSPRGLAVLALGFATVWAGCRAFGGDAPRRRVWRLCFAVLAVALAALVATVVTEFIGHPEWLPWGVKQAARRGARSGEMLQINRKGTLRGLSRLTHACGAMLVAGIVPEGADDARLRREGRLVCLLVAGLWLTYLAPAVATVFMGRPIEVDWLPSRLGIQTPGLVADRLWALMHPNSTGICAATGILCTLYCLHAPWRRGIKVLLALIIVADVMALAHSQSRTAGIALGLGLGAVVFRAVWLKRANRPRRMLLGLAAWGLTLVMTLLLVTGVFTVDVLAASRLSAAAEPNLLESMKQNAEEKKYVDRIEDVIIDGATEIADGVMVPRTMSAGFLDVFSNGRGAIWSNTVDYLIHHPADMLLGMGSDDIIDRMKAYNPERYPTQYLHNGFLEALARGGVFMLICLLGTLALLVKPAARALTAPAGADAGGYMFAVLAGTMLLLPLVESLLFTDATVYNLLFFYAAGRVTRDFA